MTQRKLSPKLPSPSEWNANGGCVGEGGQRNGRGDA
jgi:hypothetical protein